MTKISRPGQGPPIGKGPTNENNFDPASCSSSDDDGSSSHMDDFTDFLLQLGEYHPTIPESLVSYYLEQVGVLNPDTNVLKLVSMATEKLVCDIISDSSSIDNSTSIFSQDSNNHNHNNNNSSSSTTLVTDNQKGNGVGEMKLTRMSKEKEDPDSRKRSGDILLMKNLQFGLQENNISK